MRWSFGARDATTDPQDGSDRLEQPAATRERGRGRGRTHALDVDSGQGESTLTATGHARTIFRRAIDNGNLIVAEATTRELGRLTLTEALELTALYAKRDRPRYGRVAARWLQRWLEETPAPTLADVALAVGALSALGGRRHAEALAVLRAATGP